MIWPRPCGRVLAEPRVGASRDLAQPWPSVVVGMGVAASAVPLAEVNWQRVFIPK